MAIEAFQMLSTVALEKPDYYLIDPATLYRPTHAHHPVTQWVRKEPWAFGWALRFADAMMTEHEWRKGAEHACRRLQTSFKTRDKANPLNWVSCNPYGTDYPPFHSYKLTLRDKWNDSKPKWTNRGPPSWR